MTAMTLIVTIVVFTVVILIADLILYREGKQTITQVIIAKSKQYPIIAWLIGFLMGLLTGHFYG